MTSTTLTWTETGAQVGYYFYIILCTFYKVLFYRFLTFIPSFASLSYGYYFVYKSMNKFTPPVFRSFFLPSQNVHFYETRQASRGDLFQTSKNTMQYGLRALQYSGSKLWNTIRIFVRIAKSFSILKFDMFANNVAQFGHHVGQQVQVKKCSWHVCACSKHSREHLLFDRMMSNLATMFANNSTQSGKSCARTMSKSFKSIVTSMSLVAKWILV